MNKALGLFFATLFLLCAISTLSAKRRAVEPSAPIVPHAPMAGQFITAADIQNGIILDVRTKPACPPSSVANCARYFDAQWLNGHRRDAQGALVAVAWTLHNALFCRVATIVLSPEPDQHYRGAISMAHVQPGDFILIEEWPAFDVTLFTADGPQEFISSADFPTHADPAPSYPVSCP